METEKKQKSLEKEKKLSLKEKTQKQDRVEESLLRIAGYDIPGSKNIYAGMTRIKGVSWSIANILCIKLNLPYNKKISELTKEEIKRIEEFLKKATIPHYLANRRTDPETGETKHIISTDLDMKRDFDIRRMKKMRSYRGLRHSANQPVRGQRTRSHFRKRGKAVGIKRKRV